ncbi:MAG TPA: universal stress protein [Verrucomicrobiae bacterium]|nr:universal stress protein [Verrucomicrobiae bacterium]
MYRKILIALENSRSDEAILSHITEFAVHFKSELVLLHVADGWVARNFNSLKLAESDEMKEDRAYLEKIAKHLREEGLSVSTMLALGSPPAEILKVAENGHFDLIAMTGHGHRLFGDIFHGSTINEVRHKTEIPILVVRAKKK